MGSSTRRIWSAAGKLGILAIVAVAFVFGLVLTVYLSLRSPTIQVPDVVNQQYMEGETTLEKSGLNMRERARRYKPDVPPGVILDQSPRAGEVVKAGQTIAVVVSRARKEGEQPPSEEVAEERKKEETGEKRKENLNENAARNENRERRNRNRNSNSNSNGNRNANTASNTNTANRNAGNANSRPANTNRNAANRNTDDGATRPRVTTNRNTSPGGGARNTNSARPAGNSNRRPNL